MIEILRLAAKNRSVAATSMNARSSLSFHLHSLPHRLQQSIATLISPAHSTSATWQAVSASPNHTLRALASRRRRPSTSHCPHWPTCSPHSAAAVNTSPTATASSLTCYSRALSGDGKTLMIVNVSGESSNVGETICSLRFAAQVNQCELGKPKRTTRNGGAASGGGGGGGQREARMESAVVVSWWW